MKVPSRLTATAIAATAAIAVSVIAPPVHADSQTELQQRYGSLTGALMAAHASNNGQTLSAYLESKSSTLYLPQDDTAAGSPAFSPIVAAGQTALPDLAGFTAVPLRATTLPELNQQLLQNRVGLDPATMDGLPDLTQAVLSSSGTLDAAVTLNGARWATDFARTTLQAPQTPGTPAAPSVPAGALPFGLLLNKSLTAMAADAPDLLATVGTNGAGSPRVQAAWKGAMRTAWGQSSADLAKTVGDPCTGGMLAVMATGERSSAADYGSCSTACVASGMYLHRHATYLFSPASASKSTNPVAGVYNPAATYGLPLSVQAKLAANPQVSGPDTTRMLAGAGTGCGAASSAVTQGLKGVLPGVWGNLGPR